MDETIVAINEQIKMEKRILNQAEQDLKAEKHLQTIHKRQANQAETRQKKKEYNREVKTIAKEIALHEKIIKQCKRNIKDLEKHKSKLFRRGL